METLVVADTSVIVDFLQGRAPARRFIEETLAYGRLGLTSITVFELCVGLNFTDKRQQALTQLFRLSTILPLDYKAARLAAELENDLRARGEVIGLADTLIAAICLAQKRPLVSSNTRHFQRVPGLKLLTPETA
ncbi:MAG TPA: type II toxin-antitoxin system VapC family toxin [Firmicutes bacterium]|nr:hypothetical protein [Bacillota bacterium]HHV58443.1 type II toxin-antitoxin system VapC family toxin [Bacillota bacterium]